MLKTSICCKHWSAATDRKWKFPLDSFMFKFWEGVETFYYHLAIRSATIGDYNVEA